jgi:tetratricopeptide (TPR) repeat protein
MSLWSWSYWTVNPCLNILGTKEQVESPLSKLGTSSKDLLLTAEQELAVKDFLELAQIHFDVDYITAPTGSNALWAYRQVLKIEPYNQEAVDGLKKVANAVFQQAYTLYEAGQYKQALSKIEQGLEAVPKHPDLLDLKDKILQSRQMLR